MADLTPEEINAQVAAFEAALNTEAVQGAVTDPKMSITDLAEQLDKALRAPDMKIAIRKAFGAGILLAYLDANGHSDAADLFQRYWAILDIAEQAYERVKPQLDQIVREQFPNVNG